MKMHILATDDAVRLVLTSETEGEADFFNLLKAGEARIEEGVLIESSGSCRLQREGVRDLVVVIDRPG